MIRAAYVVGVLLLLGTAFLASTSGQQAQPKSGMNIDPTADIHPSVILEGKVTVGAYTKIDAGTVITGNVTIGHHSLVRCNVTIRGTNTIGNYVHIYDNVCIEGGRPAKIGSSTAEVPDKSIIGDHCWVNHGATMHGTQMANKSAVGLERLLRLQHPAGRGSRAGQRQRNAFRSGDPGQQLCRRRACRGEEAEHHRRGPQGVFRPHSCRVDPVRREQAGGSRSQKIAANSYTPYIRQHDEDRS